MMPKPKIKAYQIVVDQIKENFLSGEFKPGDKLPTERELASLFNVSRTSVREALRKLEIKGFIEIKQGSGIFIKALDFHIPNEEFTSPIRNAEKKLIYEMLELRRVLEVECAYLATQRATSEDLEQIRQSLEMMAHAKNDSALGLEADLRFHFNIVRASNNSIFLQLMENLSEHMKDTIRVTRKYRLADPDRIQDTIDEHKEIYLAIATGEADRAKQLMEKHISQIRKEISESLLINIGDQENS